MRSRSETSASPTARRQPVEVDEVAHPVRQRVGDLQHDAAALGVAQERDRTAVADGGEHRERRRARRVPAVELGPLRVAVASLVPADDPPAAVGQHRREHVEGPGEVEPAVCRQERRCVRITPLRHGDLQPGGVDDTAPIGPMRARIGDGITGWRRHRTAS